VVLYDFNFLSLMKMVLWACWWYPQFFHWRYKLRRPRNNIHQFCLEFGEKSKI